MSPPGVALVTLLVATVAVATVNCIPEKKLRLEDVSEDVVQDFSVEYEKYLHGERTEKFDQLVAEMQFQGTLNDPAFKPRTRGMEPRTSIFCLACRSGVNVLLDKRRSENVTDQYVAKLAKDICTLFNIMPENVCNGLVDLNLDTLLYIIDNNPSMNAPTLCGLLIQDGDCQTENEQHEWTIEVDKNRPKRNMQQPQQTPLESEPLTIVQLSDIHYDPNYKQGSTAVCGEPACCRAKQGQASRPEDAAGRWGDYRDCDTPWEAVLDTYEQVKRQHKDIDLIYFTGDIVDHGIWETTLEGNKESIRKVMRSMKEAFGNTTILPVLGNHEPQPLNVYSPDYAPSVMNTQWLYELAAEEWSTWLPQSALETVKRGGYYTVLVKPGFRVIALNNNLAYVYNWWLLFDPVYLKNQLQWVHDTLLQAEKAKEKVHILAHIPPGDSTNFITWDREFRRIVERFSDVITGQFNGHSHQDEFVIFYQTSGKKLPVNVAFNGGSVTAYSYGNPNYKVYQVEPETYKILEHESWIYNLTAANLTPNKNPDWYKMYSFKQDYGLNSLAPAELDKLVQKMAKDDKLANRYFEYKYKLGDLMLQRGCDKDCLKGHLCSIVTSVPGDNELCKKYFKK